MAPLFESQQFWRTRFLLHGERGYLNFLTEEGYGEWRLLYRCTRSTIVWPIKLNDWRKQWLTNENIRDKYMMTEEADPTLTDGKVHLEISNKSLYWDRAPKPCSHYLHGPRYIDCLLPLPISRLYGIRCCICGLQGYFTKSHTILVSRPILKIAISVLVEDEHTFITGFDLIHGSDIPNTPFSYRIPGKQVTLDLRGRTCEGVRDNN